MKCIVINVGIMLVNDMIITQVFFITTWSLVMHKTRSVDNRAGVNSVFAIQFQFQFR